MYNAFAYVTLNPVRARLVKKAEDWRWSAVHAHLGRIDDGITHVAAAQERLGDFATYLKQTFNDEQFAALRGSEVIGRPLGNDNFISQLEAQFDRRLKPQKRGPRKQGEKHK